MMNTDFCEGISDRSVFLVSPGHCQDIPRYPPQSSCSVTMRSVLVHRSQGNGLVLPQA